TGEHGVGIVKAPYLELKLGKEGIQAMLAVKTALDPHNIMNPGKVFAKDARKRMVVSK
ncbi:FAD-linked oxidase C-terminal domain-containing protein, partial [Bacillus velezensis]|uniref:FAD-binding oxidoreductase n=1 Tax=Bacillus velezensis TaxID=492670 RepID=UPI002FFD8462